MKLFKIITLINFVTTVILISLFLIHKNRFESTSARFTVFNPDDFVGMSQFTNYQEEVEVSIENNREYAIEMANDLVISNFVAFNEHLVSMIEQYNVMTNVDTETRSMTISDVPNFTPDTNSFNIVSSNDIIFAFLEPDFNDNGDIIGYVTNQYSMNEFLNVNTNLEARANIRDDYDRLLLQTFIFYTNLNDLLIQDWERITNINADVISFTKDDGTLETHTIFVDHYYDSAF